MVMTHAQEVSTSHAAGQCLGADLPAASVPASQAGVPAPPSPPPQLHQEDWIAALAMQVQSLVAAVQVLQRQSAAAQQQPGPPLSVPRVVQPRQHSSRGRSPVREARHHRASPRPHRREAYKRPWSPSRHASASPKRRHGRKAVRPRQHRRHPSPSSESSREGSFDGRIARQAKRRLDEYNQRMEELSRRITNPPKADYYSRPPLSRRIMEELPNVLWAYYTTPRAPVGETPFSLIFEAIIPVEIGAPSPRTESYGEEDNSTQLWANLDLVEEMRDRARIWMAAYRQRTTKYYNERVRSRTFLSRDLVLRRAEVSKTMEGGKLSPNREEPYRVTEVLHHGAYRIEGLDGKPLPRTWNTDNHRRYYQ